MHGEYGRCVEVVNVGRGEGLVRFMEYGHFRAYPPCNRRSPNLSSSSFSPNRLSCPQYRLGLTHSGGRYKAEEVFEPDPYPSKFYVTKDDPSSPTFATTWFEKSATLGYAPAMVRMALIASHPPGIAQCVRVCVCVCVCARAHVCV